VHLARESMTITIFEDGPDSTGYDLWPDARFGQPFKEYTELGNACWIVVTYYERRMVMRRLRKRFCASCNESGARWLDRAVALPSSPTK
jgi:hypothetical protein